MKHITGSAPTKILIYVVGIAVAAGALVAYLYIAGPQGPRYSWLDVVFWVGLVAWSTRVAVALPFNAAMSHLFVIILGAIILFPPWLAMLIVAVGYFSSEFGKPTFPWYKDLFNRAQNTLVTGLAALVWHFLTEVAPVGLGRFDISAGVAIVAASFVLFISNITLVYYVIHLASGAPFRKIWVDNFRWLSLSYFVLAPIGLFMARAYQIPLVGGWGGFSVLFILMLLYYSRFYWDERVKLQEALDSTIEVLVKALDAKDPHTRLHSERVAAISKDLAKAAGLDESDQRKIEYGARIHDIGKVSIPDSILLKPGRLTEEEFNQIKLHPTDGIKLLQPAQRYMRDVLPIIRHHHERWDGRGYPDGLAGQETHLWARIVALGDAYEAMTAGRPYVKAKTPEEALREIMDLAGSQFDPKLAKLFHELWLQDPLWKDREVFLRASTSQAPSSDSSAPSSPAPAYRTSEELN
ncbi:HD-GYP domain-containing protein [Allomeiothermus silvanus]|uniref:HD-GYP domain-containing protein n=1 Tax=Allomeiothermus silvanus TaxID=52022 RepID=UPI0030B82398